MLLNWYGTDPLLHHCHQPQAVAAKVEDFLRLTVLQQWAKIKNAALLVSEFYKETFCHDVLEVFLRFQNLGVKTSYFVI